MAAIATLLNRAVICRLSKRWLTVLLTRQKSCNVRNVCRPAAVVPPRQFPTYVYSQRKWSSSATKSDDEVVSFVQQAEKVDQQRELRVKWGDGFENAYPYVWLRDNCFCPSCYQADARSRLLTMEDLDVDILASDTALSEDGQSLTVYWPDGHQSTFTSVFLRGTVFEERRPKKNVQLWGSELLRDLPTFSFQKMLTDDRVLLQCLETLRDVGLILMKNVPLETGQVKRMAERISFLRVTSYGAEFTVKSKIEPSNLAYTGAKLALHQDLPFYEHMPSIQFLHCIYQCEGEGGDSVFSDGFKCALQLKREDPEAFDILSNTYINYMDIGNDYVPFHTKSAQKVFQFDQFGELYMVRYNNAMRDITLPVPREKVYKYYRALKAYNNILNSPENSIAFNMQNGDMAVFNNIRVLHGRTAFINNATSGERHLEGGYIDWDDAHSRIRVLRANFGLPIQD